MRIAIVTQEEPFYLPPALDALCRALPEEIVGLIILPSFNEALYATGKRLYEFYGPKDFGRLLHWFVWARIADNVNRYVSLTRPYSARDIARRCNIPLYHPKKINTPEFVDVLDTEIQPDLIMSVAASQIFRKCVLEIPRFGCINLHSAPLPRYQGMMPNFWTMLNAEPEAAVTVHYMVEKLDSGDILVQLPVPIYPDDSLHHLMIRSKKIGVHALLQAIQKIREGNVNGRPMDTSGATYYSFPKRSDAQRLRELGRALF